MSSQEPPSLPRDKRRAVIESLPLEEIGGRRTSFVQTLREIIRNRNLVDLLVRREIKARYKDSSLGLLWSLVRPLVQLLIYFFALGQILGLARAIPDFAIFIYIGLTMWGLFSEITLSTTTSIIGNSGLIKKVYLPREIFPLSAVGGALFNFLVQAAVLLVAILVLSNLEISLNLFYIPLAILTLLTFATAVGLALSALNVYMRDIQHLVEVAIAVLFWASPIAYSFSFVHNSSIGGTWIEDLYLANPVTACILAMQKALWSAGTADPAQVWPDDLLVRLIITLMVSVILLFVSQRLFSRLQGNFAQEL